MTQEVIVGAGAETAETLRMEGSSATGKKRMTYTEFLDNSPMTPFLWYILMGCSIAQVLDGFDFQATSFVLPLVLKDFHITTMQAGAIASWTNSGLLVGALVFGPLADRIGRKIVFQQALFLYSFGTLLSALAPTYTFLLAARFIAGLGIAAEFPVAIALLAEYAPIKRRHIFVGLSALAYSVGWFVCAIVATLVTPRWGWRALYWVGVAPGLMIPYVQRYIPESVRFLLLRNRVEEAGKITRNIADRSGFADVELVPPPPVKMARKQTLLKRFASLETVALSLILICVFQLANNVQVVGIQTWLPSIFIRAGFTMIRSFNFTLLVLAVTPLGQILGIWVQGKMPHKWAMLLLTALAALCFFGFGLSFEYKYPIAVIVACNMGYQFFSGAVIPIVNSLSVELFPTKIRSSARGLFLASGRVGAVTGPLALGFFLTLGTQIHQIIYYFATPPILAAILVVIFLKVDSRHKTLEAIADL